MVNEFVTRNLKNLQSKGQGIWSNALEELTNQRSMNRVSKQSKNWQPKDREKCNTTNEVLTTPKSRTMYQSNSIKFNQKVNETVATQLNNLRNANETATRQLENWQPKCQITWSKATGNQGNWRTDNPKLKETVTTIVKLKNPTTR